MLHHFRQALSVYKSRGVVELMKTAARYVPIELNNLNFRLQYGPPAYVMEEDWDTLILLDACRYDMFEEENDIPGDLQTRISAGSTSEEFLDRNFSGNEFYDTVYINTNPYLPKLGLDDGTFHAVVDLLDEWDDDLQTIPPEIVVEAALDAHNRFPNKRLIVHFMQPHVPFIGETGHQINAKGWDRNVAGLPGETVWQQLRNGTDNTDPSLELVWDGYRENLEIVLSHAEHLIEQLDGKTVVSSDHGNMVGERILPFLSRPKYGHFYGVYTPELVCVPWHVVEHEDRRSISTDPPIATEQRADDVVEKRLDALGYQ